MSEDVVCLTQEQLRGRGGCTRRAMAGPEDVLTDEQDAALRRLKAVVRTMLGENAETPMEKAYQNIARITQLVREDTLYVDCGQGIDTQDMRLAAARLIRVARGSRGRHSLGQAYALSSLKAKLVLMQQQVRTLQEAAGSPRRDPPRQVVELHVPPSAPPAAAAEEGHPHGRAAALLQRVGRGARRRERIAETLALRTMREGVRALRQAFGGKLPDTGDAEKIAAAEQSVVGYVVQQANKIKVLQMQLDASRELQRGAPRQHSLHRPRTPSGTPPTAPDPEPATPKRRTSSPTRIVRQGKGVGPAIPGPHLVLSPSGRRVGGACFTSSKGSERARSPQRESSYTSRSSVGPRSSGYARVHTTPAATAAQYHSPSAPPKLPDHPVISLVHTTVHKGGGGGVRVSSPGRRTGSPPPRKDAPQRRTASPARSQGDRRVDIAMLASLVHHGEAPPPSIAHEVPVPLKTPARRHH